MPSFDGLHIDTQHFLAPLPIPPKHRLVHKSQRVLCTFAYAVTRASATRILREFAREEEHHGTVAYDVRILEACRDLGFKCWSVNPELFHHVDDQASEIKVSNARGSKSARPSLVKQLFDPPPSAEDTRKAQARGTPNIGCSVRGIVDKLGADKADVESATLRGLRDVMKAARQVDGVCPVSLVQIDALKAEVVEKGRSNLPIG
jgi:hypothetical protein